MSATVKVTNYARSGSEGDSAVSYLPQHPSELNRIYRQKFLKKMVKSLPAPIQNRVIALKNLQLEVFRAESKYHEEVFALACRYQPEHKCLFDKRSDIIAGRLDPPQEKPQFKSLVMEILLDNSYTSNPLMVMYKQIPQDAKGIPYFWLTIFRATQCTDWVRPRDEEVFKKLIDISVQCESDKSFTLSFCFDENKYFRNTVLTKKYYMKSFDVKDEPFNFGGLKIYKCEGCLINWKDNMNLSVMAVSGSTRPDPNLNMIVASNSFFRFFDPPQILGEVADADEDTQEILCSDFELGNYLRTRVVPRAVCYYTGDIVDDDDSSEYEAEELSSEVNDVYEIDVEVED